MTDRARLDEECSALFEGGKDLLAPGRLPVLCELVKQHTGIDLDELSVRTVLAQALLRAEAQAEVGRHGALVGARAYLLLDGGPDPAEAAQIRLKHRQPAARADSQALRFSWAYWQQLRQLRRGRAVPVPNERSGRNQRDAYAAALADSVWALLESPAGLISAVRAVPDAEDQYSAALQGVIRDAALYVTDVRPDPALLVHRELEAALLKALKDGGRPWPRVVVGDAGFGKSTLLWSLHASLVEDPEVVPVLLSAGWFVEYTDKHDVTDVAALLAEPRERGRRTVVLLDTVDALVHDDRSRRRLLRLIDALFEAGIPAVFACRPREAASLTHTELRTHALGAYSDTERDAAVRALAREHVENADEERIARDIASANARGLPVEDVSRNPLLLWMMFSLAAPAAPTLADIDVTSLFRGYWDRRIAQDIRSTVELQYRAADQDMSDTAGATAAVLLTVGAPDLALDELRAGVSTIARYQRARRDLEVLRERGVLADFGPHVGFFHQTLFEYAAAQALLTRDPAQALAMLAARATMESGDLFVAAVWEQALILAGQNPLHRHHLSALPDQVLAAGSPVAEAALLVAWAHHPTAVQLPESLPAHAELSAVVRAAQIIPAVSAGTAQERVEQLLLLLASRDDKQLWTEGLEGLTRLVARDPTVGNGLADLIRDALHSPHADFLAAVFDLAAAIAPRDPGTIRALVLAEAADPTHGTLSAILPELARLWPILGDADALAAATRIVADRGWGNQFLPVLGTLIAAEWHRQGADVQLELVSATIPPGADAPVSRAVVYAAAEYLSRAADRADTAELVRILVEGLPPGLFDVGKEALRTLLGSESPAALQAERRIRSLLSTVGADAQLNRLTPVQLYLLEMLALSQPTAGLLPRVLPARLGPRDWSAAPSLARLAPGAADQGHAAARRFLQHLAKSDTASDTVLDAVFAASTIAAAIHDEVFDLLVVIALKHRRTASADTLVTSASYRSARVGTHARRILAYANERLDTTDAADSELGLVAAIMSRAELDLQWDGIHRLLERVHDPRRLGPLLEALWVQTPPGDTTPQLEFLSRFIHVDPAASTPVTRASPDVPITVALSAAKAHQRILGHRATASPDAWPTLRALTLYDVETEDIFFNGSRFVVACDYLMRLADDRPAETGPFLHDLLSAAVAGTFVGITPRLWARETGAVIAKCLRAGSIAVRDLADLCLGPLDDDVARLIMSVLADTDYRQARPALLDIARRAQDPTTRANATAIVRDHDRQHGTGAFPEIQALFTAR
jgi:hypothetical protein